MPIKIALPKGRLLDETAQLLQSAGWGLNGYHKDTRLYRFDSDKFPCLFAKVFNEKDIPVQVAIGNYDLGICGLDWVEELLTRYPSSALVRVINLGYGSGTLYLVAGSSSGLSSVDEAVSKMHTLRIASEYPNLAEALALDLRIRRFNVYPLWGAAVAYPPETADLALVPGEREGDFYGQCLEPMYRVLSYSAFVVANKYSLEKKDMSDLLVSLSDRGCSGSVDGYKTVLYDKGALTPSNGVHPDERAKETIRLALPDGHQQKPTLDILHRAGIRIDDYPSPTGNRRPYIYIDGVEVKVIRPQDMPLQVANGNFDLAITGRDWVREHLYQFPSSPVQEIVGLGYGWVRIVAVVVNDMPVSDIDGLRKLALEESRDLRIASEYTNIADKYARDNHLGNYRIIPTWGATEAFLPEDADLLIENTQTGRTLAKNNLKIIDTFFESTACLIGNSRATAGQGKRENMEAIIEAMKLAVEDI